MVTLQTAFAYVIEQAVDVHDEPTVFERRIAGLGVAHGGLPLFEQESITQNVQRTVVAILVNV